MAIGSGYVPQAGPATAPSVGVNSDVSTVLTAAQQELVNTARRNALRIKTIRGYNKMLNAIIEFLEITASENDEFITNGTIDDLVVPIDFTRVDDKAAYQMSVRPLRYRTKDLIYINLQKKMLELFFATPGRFDKKDKHGNVKLNTDGKAMECGFVHRRKHCDSLKYGRKLANGSFCSEIQNSMPDIIKGLANLNAELKHAGQVEENDADEIPPELFELMLESAMEKGNHLMWAMSVLQWSLMARSQNIDNLVFRSFTMGSDSIRVKFNQTKMNPSGHKTTSKNCYANPHNVRRCMYTSLAVYFCKMNETWSKEKSVDFIFIKRGANVSSASKNYSAYVKKWANENWEVILNFIRPGHVSVHSFRKGPATEVSTSPESSLPSIFHRGEWSLGVVQDIYFKFAEKGDHVIGRILGGLDPDSADFDVLPPHWTVPDDKHIKEAMELCFGNILSMLEDEDTFMPAILSRCLASLVYHEQSLRVIIQKNPKHPWRCLPIFTNDELLGHLKSIVTTEPTKGVLEKPTGLARNTTLLKHVREMVESFREDKRERAIEREDRKSAYAEIKTAVKEALEEQALSNGHLTYASFSNILDVRESTLLGSVTTRMDEVVARIETAMSQSLPANQRCIIQSPRTPAAAIASDSNRLYEHADGKMYFTPEGYELPEKASLRAAFQKKQVSVQHFECGSMVIHLTPTQSVHSFFGQ